MRSAAAAFAWEFRRRLRWGLIALGLYFVVLATFQFLILGPRSPIHPLHSMTFAFTVNVPLAFAFMYFLAVFSYGLAGEQQEDEAFFRLLGAVLRAVPMKIDACEPRLSGSSACSHTSTARVGIACASSVTTSPRST